MRKIKTAADVDIMRLENLVSTACSGSLKYNIVGLLVHAILDRALARCKTLICAYLEKKNI
jgi:hypothetical protein